MYYQRKESENMLAGLRLMKRLKSFVMVAVLGLALHEGAQAALDIKATSVLGANCTVTVMLNAATYSFYGAGLTYTFIGNGGTATFTATPPSSSPNPVSFPVPPGSYTLYIGVGPFPTAPPNPAAGYQVTVAPCPLSNTGVGSGCKTLQAGDVDPHWQLAAPFPSAPSGPPLLATSPPTGQPTTYPTNFGPVYVTGPYPGWLPTDLNASMWITPSWTPAGATPVSGGQYVYRTTFQASVPAVIEGSYSSDNELLGVYLNGMPVSIFLNSVKGFTKWTGFIIGLNSPLLAPINTLDFVVENLGAGGQPIQSDDNQFTPAGLRVQFTDFPTSGGGSCQHILPQFAFGGGWYSALYFTNATSFNVSFPVSFFTDAGTPLNVPSAGGSSTTVTLGPQATTIIEAPNSGSLTQGYVSALLPMGVSVAVEVPVSESGTTAS